MSMLQFRLMIHPSRFKQTVSPTILAMTFRKCFFYRVLNVVLLTAFLSRCAGLSPNIRYEGLMCNDHPAREKRTWTPVLIRSWVFDRLSSTDFDQDVYLARYTGHTYAPISNQTSTKYAGLDMFYMGGKLRNPNIRMYFQRDVKVYMLVSVSGKDFDASKFASLLGWENEGWAERVAGSHTITYGLHVKRTKPLTSYAYVFSKSSTDKKIDIPQTRFVQMRIDGISVGGSFNLLIAESDGSASPPVGKFKGRTILPNEECPQGLHNRWVARDRNRADRHTRRIRFGTWHPQWDPCHWCAYNHDHGSSPKHLFGYDPKFNYVSFKNGNDDESNSGFKGFVYETLDHYVYYSLHSQTSGMSRIRRRFHTAHLVVADRRSREVLVDVNHRADFGFQSVRLPRNKFRPISEVDREIQANQTSVRPFRSVAVIDVNNLNTDYFYRNPVLLGNYEEWQTMPLCCRSANPQNLFRVTFKLPATGIKHVDEPDARVDLGVSLGGQFIKSPNLVRALHLSSIEVSDKHCPDGRNGEFYTDIFGNPVHGPGPNNVRQYIKPGFRVTLQGRFEPEEVWVGIHGNNKRGFFADHGYGINPDVN